MEIITANEFEEKNNIETVEKLMKMEGGYITSKQLTELGIHRMYLKIMNNRGYIKKVGNGIYIEKNKTPDPYYILSLELPNVVFSHMTALYFHNLYPHKPKEKFDITVPNNYFNYKLKNYNVFYDGRDVHEIGLTNVETPMGNLVKTYDIERCICDIIKSRKRLGIEKVINCLHEYLNMRNKNLVKVYKYAELLNIKKDVIQMIDIASSEDNNENIKFREKNH